MTYCQPNHHQSHVYPCYPSPSSTSSYSMADWPQPNPQGDPQHPFNFLSPIDTQQQFKLPPHHVLEYLSPPMPPSPYTPQSFHSATPPPTLQRYPSSQSINFPPMLSYSQGPAAQATFSPSHTNPFRTPPPPAQQRPRSRGRAVCIGINYFNQKGEMRGRVDEARNLSNYLQQVKNYTADSIILLTDDQNGPFGQPTKRNILNAFHWLGEHAFPGERIVLYYSGHGKVPAVGKKSGKSQQQDQMGNETETIYPVDFRSFKEGMIKPEELEELLEPVRRKGARLMLILDTHAGIAEKKASPKQHEKKREGREEEGEVFHKEARLPNPAATFRSTSPIHNHP